MYSLDNGSPSPADVFYKWKDIENDTVPMNDAPEKDDEYMYESPLVNGPPAYSHSITIPTKRRPISEHCVNMGLIIVTFVILYNVMKKKTR